MLSHPLIHLITRTLSCAVILTSVALLGPGQATAAPATADPVCAPFTAILVPGTGETTPTAAPDQPAGMLAPIGQGLRQRYGADITVRTLAYTASPIPYRVSETAGVQALSTMLAGLCSSTRVVLAGYSQGADIAGDVTTAIGNNRGPLPASRVVAVALLSDPRRDPATPQLGPAQSGEGIAGPRGEGFGALADRVRTVCTAGDLYCATTPQASPALTALGRAVTGNPPPPASDATASGPAHTPAPAPGTQTGPGLLPGPAPAAVGSLDGLDPSAVVDQVVTVLAGLTGFAANVPAILGALAQLPGLIASGNIPGLHQVSGELNTRFAPLVQMAAGIDLHLVARALTLAAPLDPSGWTGLAAQIIALVANVDIGRLATDIGQAQEIAWHALETLTRGDPAGAALTLTGLLPIAADLAATAASALTGDAGTHLAGLAHTFTTTTTPETSTALADLDRQTGEAARFAGSDVHRNGYTTATTHALNWLTSRIDATR
ncbi:cutinase family protein [Nocardia wallacei]|uniref:cutinase family protein n=1 Tax=Nocardia wallacei TaxID=480035 RepID=UPI002456317B|nr:cutinase family protein [Nocardia wallacei]